MSKVSSRLIVEAMIKTIVSTQDYIQEVVAANPARAFEVVALGRRQKKLKLIDLLAEEEAKKSIRRMLGTDNVRLEGEESLADPAMDLTREDRLCVLMDVIDGTDLLERGLSNWCSAVVVFDARARAVRAAFVGLPNEAIIYATDDSDIVLKQPIARGRNGKLATVGEPEPVSGPSLVTPIERASIAFYGQKVANLRSMIESPGFGHLIKLQGASFRFYNFAGNPVMMRIIDGHIKVDAIIETEGQAPHDVVPGAFIAMKAGAVLLGLDGEPIDLGRALLRPAATQSELRYILAANRDLGNELCSLFSLSKT